MNKAIIMEKVNLTDVPYGDYYQMIYHIEKDDESRIYINCNPHQDKKGKYYEISFKDMMDEIEKQNKSKISSFVMIAEFGLSGKVYRYNNYGNGELLEVGTTKGYA